MQPDSGSCLELEETTHIGWGGTEGRPLSAVAKKLFSPSLLLSGIISLDNNKQEGASRLLLHGLGTLLSLMPQAPEKGAKPFIMFISDEVLLA